jgi:hypothetical protein
MGKYDCYSYWRCEKYRKWKFTVRTAVIKLHSPLICTRFYELQKIKFHWNLWPSSELPAVMSEWVASHLWPTSTKKYWEWDGIILLKFLFCGRECVNWHITFFSFPFLSSDISREVWLQNAVRVLSSTPEVQCVPSFCRLMLHRTKLHIRYITFKNSEDKTLSIMKFK